MQRLEVSGAVRPIYGSLGVKRLTENTNWPFTKTIRVCFMEGLSAYRTVNTARRVYKTSLLMPYKAIVAVCSEARTQHINTM